MPGDEAASPLTVILFVALVTAALVGIAFYFLVDRDRPDQWDIEATGGAEPGFVVAKAPEGVAWEDLTVQLLNSGGRDRADLYLEAPAGRVEEGQVLTLDEDAPAGTYMLRILSGEDELARASVEL